MHFDVKPTFENNIGSHVGILLELSSEFCTLSQVFTYD